jgi:esterase
MTAALAHHSFGAGPPLIILHGLFGSARNWTSVAKRFADHHRVFALDLRNHGDSPWRNGMSFPSMAADVVAFMDDHGLERATMIGHSMGGKVAMALALEHGGRVGALVVVDIAPVAYGGGYGAFVEAMQGVDLTDVRRRSDVDARLAAVIEDPGVRAFLMQNLVDREGRYAWRLNLEALGGAMDRIVGFPSELLQRSYDGPTLFLAGARSNYIRPEHDALIRRLFPRARVESVAEAGHWVHADQPKAFVDRVREFLADAG